MTKKKNPVARWCVKKIFDGNVCFLDYGSFEARVFNGGRLLCGIDQKWMLQIYKNGFEDWIVCLRGFESRKSAKEAVMKILPWIGDLIHVPGKANSNLRLELK